MFFIDAVYAVFVQDAIEAAARAAGEFCIVAIDGGSFTSIRWWIFYIDALDAGVFYIVAVDGGGSVTSMP